MSSHTADFQMLHLVHGLSGGKIAEEHHHITAESTQYGGGYQVKDIHHLFSNPFYDAV